MSQSSERRTAVDVIGALLEAHQEIESVRVFQPQRAPLAQERLTLDETIRAVLAEGMRIREAHGFSFWDAVLAASLKASPEVATELLRQASYHNPPPELVQWIERREWCAQASRAIEELQAGRLLAVSSKVRLRQGGSLHIPMVDFHCPAPRHTELAVAVCRLLGGGGYLLHSGNSYHFYGKHLLDDGGLRAFLGRCLLLSPLVDRPWIAHQLMEGCCGLRISPKPGTGHIPVVVREI